MLHPDESIVENRRKQYQDTYRLYQQIVRDNQDNCLHLQGMISLYPGQRTSIVWHEFPGGRIEGLCSWCGRHFVPEDSDYTSWRSLPSGNILSKSATSVEVVATKSIDPREFFCLHDNFDGTLTGSDGNIYDHNGEKCTPST